MHKKLGQYMNIMYWNISGKILIMYGTGKIFLKNYVIEQLGFLGMNVDLGLVDFILIQYDPGYDRVGFTIDLEVIVGWLGIEKGHLKKLLESNFKIESDYTISKETDKKGIGKNNRKIVLLTYDCAKLLCMISKTEKAKNIRQYWIELEKIMVKYKRD